MSNTNLKLLALLSLCSMPALAGESAGEKVKASANDVGRAAKKAGHRVEETLCTGTKVECEKKKLGNRAKEAKDAVSDKAEETKDKLDRDGR